MTKTVECGFHSYFLPRFVQKFIPKASDSKGVGECAYYI